MDWREAWVKSAKDPVMFAEGVLGATLQPQQRQALEAIGRDDRVAIRSGHDQGKSAVGAMSVWWWFFCRTPVKIPVVANTQMQLRDVEWAEICMWGRNKLPPELRDQVEIGAERIYLKAKPDDHFMVPRTASRDNPEALQGFHSPNLFFLICEASGIDDIVFEVARGALASAGSKQLMVGNPTRTNGYYHRAFHQNRHLWTCLSWPWRQNPWSSPSYPKEIADEYGEHSNVYRVRVLGEFPVADDNAVIPLSIVEAAISRDVDLADRRATVWGVDVARYGDDRSALIRRRGNHILGPAKVWRHKDTMQSSGIVAREFFETSEGDRPAAINVDVIGVGAGVVDRLRELGLPVFGVNVGETAEQPERFMRRRDELWWKARDWFMAADCKIPDDPHLISDLTGPTYKLLSSGKLQVEPKDDMKKRGLASPDVADAFCLTFAGGEFAHRYRNMTSAISDYDRLDIDGSNGLDLPAFASE